MRRVLPLLVLVAGCVGPETFPDDPSLSYSERRELDLKRNLRDDRTWDEHERQIAELRSMMGVATEDDALGPTQTKPAK